MASIRIFVAHEFQDLITDPVMEQVELDLQRVLYKSLMISEENMEFIWNFPRRVTNLHPLSVDVMLNDNGKEFVDREGVKELGTQIALHFKQAILAERLRLESVGVFIIAMQNSYFISTDQLRALGY